KLQKSFKDKAPKDRVWTVSESFATFARKSWMTSSRSPSPSRREPIGSRETSSKETTDSSSRDDHDSITASSTSSTSPRQSLTLNTNIDKNAQKTKSPNV